MQLVSMLVSCFSRKNCFISQKLKLVLNLANKCLIHSISPVTSTLQLAYWSYLKVAVNTYDSNQNMRGWSKQFKPRSATFIKTCLTLILYNLCWSCVCLCVLSSCFLVEGENRIIELCMFFFLRCLYCQNETVMIQVYAWVSLSEITVYNVVIWLHYI